MRERVVLVVDGVVAGAFDLAEVGDILTEAGAAELVAELRQLLGETRREKSGTRRRPKERSA